MVHVLGSGEGRDRCGRAIVAEARRRGIDACQVGYAAPTASRPLPRWASFLWAVVVLGRYRVVRVWWRLRYRGRLTVVTGHWYDAFGGPDRSGRQDDDARALRASRWLWSLAPRSTIAVVLDDEDGRRPRPEAGDWRPWMWLQLAPWFAAEVIVGSGREPELIGRRAVDALFGPAPRSYQWAVVPITRRGEDARTTVGPDAGVAGSVHGTIHGRTVAKWVNTTVLRSRLGVPDVAPVDGLPELCRTLGVVPDALAAARSKKPGRLVVGVAAGGELRLVLKVAPAGDAGLLCEAEMLGKGSPALNGIPVPTLVWAGEWQDRFVVATAAIAHRRKAYDATLADVVGVCVQLAGTGVAGGTAIVHGDLGPWNLLVPAGRRRSRDFVLVDWEHASFGRDPLHDLAHFAVQRGSLLRRARPARVVADLVDRGSVGWRYLEAVGEDPGRAAEFVVRYLRAVPTVTPFHQAMIDQLTSGSRDRGRRQEQDIDPPT